MPSACTAATYTASLEVQRFKHYKRAAQIIYQQLERAALVLARVGVTVLGAGLHFAHVL